MLPASPRDQLAATTRRVFVAFSAPLRPNLESVKVERRSLRVHTGAQGRGNCRSGDAVTGAHWHSIIGGKPIERGCAIARSRETR